MTISAGDTLPDITLKTMLDGKPSDIKINDAFAGKKAILFAVPGAFTPTCSAAHLPGFVVNADKLEDKGIDMIACTAVNDVFVMDAWGKSSNAEKILMLADGNAELAKALGLLLDGSEFGMGLRSKRYAMIVDDAKVSGLYIDEKGLAFSSAEHVLQQL